MNNKKVFSITIFSSLFLITTIIFSCKKEPGTGGRATIKGFVVIRDYDASYTIYRGSYPAQGENVYILYGNSNAVEDNTKTSYDGSFEFPYLRTGKYRVFVVSKDTSQKINNKTIEVMKEINITDKKQVAVLDTISIIN